MAIVEIPYYTPQDWYWAVNGSTTHVFSSDSGDYVPVSDGKYQAWLALGRTASAAADEAEVAEHLIAYSQRPVAAGVLDAYKDKQAAKLTVEVIAKILFWCVNQIRTIQGQETISAQQFKAFLKGLM